MASDGLSAPASQAGALARIPPGDMLVDPAKLAAVLEEPAGAGGLSPVALLLWTLVSLLVTVGAAIWWAAGGH